MTIPNAGYAPWVLEGRGGITISQRGLHVVIEGAGSSPPSGPAGGDLAGTYPNPTVDGLQGVPIDAAAPAPGDFLAFDGVNWVPSPGAGGGPPTGPAGGDLAGLYPNPTVDGLQGVAVDPAAPALGEVLTFNGVAWEALPPASVAPSGPAGGDLAGTYPNPTVDGLQTVPVAAAAPNPNDVLTFSGGVWTPLAPASVAPSGPAGGDLAGTYPNPTVDGLQTVPVAAAAPNPNDVLTFSGGVWTPLAPASVAPSGPAGGDLAGTYPNPTVDGLQTVPVAAAAPNPGDVLTFSGGVWTPVAPAAGDLTAVTGSEGIVVTSGTGPVPNVALPSTSDGNLLVYDTANPGWEPAGTQAIAAAAPTWTLDIAAQGLFRVQVAGGAGLFFELDDDVSDPVFRVNDDIEGGAFRTTSQLLFFSDSTLTWQETETVRAAVSTSNATPATIFTIALDDDTATAFDVKIVAKGNSSADCASFNLSMTWVRDGGGAPVATVTGVTSSDARATTAYAALAATMALSSNNVVGTVTGLAGTNIEWSAVVQMVRRTAT